MIKYKNKIIAVIMTVVVMMSLIVIPGSAYYPLSTTSASKTYKLVDKNGNVSYRTITASIRPYQNPTVYDGTICGKTFKLSSDVDLVRWDFTAGLNTSNNTLQACVFVLGTGNSGACSPYFTFDTGYYTDCTEVDPSTIFTSTDYENIYTDPDGNYYIKNADGTYSKLEHLDSVTGFYVKDGVLKSLYTDKFIDQTGFGMLLKFYVQNYNSLAKVLGFDSISFPDDFKWSDFLGRADSSDFIDLWWRDGGFGDISRGGSFGDKTAEETYRQENGFGNDIENSATGWNAADGKWMWEQKPDGTWEWRSVSETEYKSIMQRVVNNYLNTDMTAEQRATMESLQTILDGLPVGGTVDLRIPQKSDGTPDYTQNPNIYKPAQVYLTESGYDHSTNTVKDSSYLPFYGTPATNPNWPLEQTGTTVRPEATPTPSPTASPGGDSSSGGGWFGDLLSKIFNMTIGFLLNIIKTIFDGVFGLIEIVITSLTNLLTKFTDISVLIGSLFGFLPSELSNVLTLGLSLSFVAVVIKILRG